jgi:RNA polymerase sigma-70 factor (ECF subfamily)
METAVSLLDRLRTGTDSAAWQRLDDLYRPLIHRWILRDAVLRNDAEDVVQDVMSVLVRELPRFHRERTGSFRLWLRTITHNRVLAFRHKSARQRAAGDDGALAQLADPNSELSRLWDREHDEFVLRRLLELLESDPPFEKITIRAFRMVFLEERTPADVAASLGISINSVLLAKSRILKWLRQESGDFLT